MQIPGNVEFPGIFVYIDRHLKIPFKYLIIHTYKTYRSKNKDKSSIKRLTILMGATDKKDRIMQPRKKKPRKF